MVDVLTPLHEQSLLTKEQSLIASCYLPLSILMHMVWNAIKAKVTLKYIQFLTTSAFS